MSPAIVSQETLEDPLAYLRCSIIVEHKKGQAIYTQDRPSTAIYLVINGQVKVCRPTSDGHEMLVDIYKPDEFFGESAFLHFAHCGERATALENTKLMTWTTEEIEEIIQKRSVRRALDLGQRIESFSGDKIAHRLARSLIRFAERLGSMEEDGSVRMAPFTHELLSQYIGTSREMVTHYMNQFRCQAYLRYSRQGIILNKDALKEWLRQNA